MLPLNHLNELATIGGVAVGVIGAALTATKLIQRHHEKRFQTNVKLAHGIPTFSDGRLGPDVMLIEAMNPGLRSVTLTSCGILLPNRKTLVCPFWSGGPNLPYDLSAGKNCLKWMETIPIAQALLGAGYEHKVKLVGFYDDALGVRHRSKQLEFDVPMWLERHRRGMVKI